MIRNVFGKFFEEKYVKTERAKSGRASLEKGDVCEMHFNIIHFFRFFWESHAS